MAVSNYQIFLYVNGRELKDSKNLEALWKSLSVSADGGVTNTLTIKEGTAGNAGKFDFGNKKLGGITAGAASGEAITWEMIGAANGVAGLDSGGKVPVSQLPNSIMEYKGTYDPTGGSGAGVPALANGTGDSGDVYKVIVAGSHDFGAGAISFVVGDYVIYNGSVWEKAHSGADAVISVNGQAGAVTLTTDNVSEGSTNKYYTATQARTDIIASSITSGDTTHAPSGGAVYTALAGKADVSALGGSQYANFTNKDAGGTISTTQFVKMLVAGQVTLLTSTDSVGEETFFGCVKSASIAADAAGDIYLPQVGARVTGFADLDVTKLLYAHASTAGSYTQTRPTSGKVIILGKPISATEIIFIGRYEYAIT